MKLEKTCKCIAALSRVNDNNPEKTCEFIVRREYQVDVYPLYYQIYQNGGWDDYVFISSDEEFNEYFKLIE